MQNHWSRNENGGKKKLILFLSLLNLSRALFSKLRYFFLSLSESLLEKHSGVFSLFG
jgi:hypothetical protein